MNCLRERSQYALIRASTKEKEMLATTQEELLKNNAIALVKEHKKCCDDPECGISTYLIYTLLLKAGINLTNEEMTEFV